MQFVVTSNVSITLCISASIVPSNVKFKTDALRRSNNATSFFNNFYSFLLSIKEKLSLDNRLSQNYPFLTPYNYSRSRRVLFQKHSFEFAVEERITCARLHEYYSIDDTLAGNHNFGLTGQWTSFNRRDLSRNFHEATITTISSREIKRNNT